MAFYDTNTGDSGVAHATGMGGLLNQYCWHTLENGKWSLNIAVAQAPRTA